LVETDQLAKIGDGYSEILVPPLTEQRRTVDLLSRAEGIVRLRREAQAKALAVIPALFLDMFGDPATNPRGWIEAPLGGIVEEFRYGTSQKAGGAGLPTLRIPNVISDRLDTSDMKLVAVPDAEADRLRLRAGDLLFVRTNGNPDYVGRSAVFDPAAMTAAGFNAANCIYASYLIRARLRAEPVRPRYLQSFLSSHEGRKRLRERVRTSAGQYNINTEGLSSVRIPLAPMEAQVSFEERSRATASIVAQQTEALRRADAVFRAILSRAFDGEPANVAKVG
jgi:type I restriction enzyme S subunit